MATIGQMFRNLFIRIKTSHEGHQTPTLTAADTAERLQLLLSCGF